MGSLEQRKHSHALVIPVDLQGHWNPLKILLRQLVDLGISLTVLSTQTWRAELQQLKANGEFKNLEAFELVEVFGKLETNKMSAGKIVEEMEGDFNDHPSIMEKLVAQRCSGLGPTFMISDMLLYWTQDVADQLGIPRYNFMTSPCTYALLMLHAPDIIAKSWHPANPELAKRNEVVDLPGLRHFRAGDFPIGLYETSDAYKHYSSSLPRAAGLVINSFEPYEAGEICALRAQLQRIATDRKGIQPADHLRGGTLLGISTAGSRRWIAELWKQVPKVFFVGPLLYLSSFSSDVHTSVSTQKEEQCLQFLHSKPAASVLYICFGTLGQLSRSGITELARGLVLSKASFLWVLPPPKDAPPSWDISHVLPEGFQLRTEGRGLVWTSWAPQKEILNHSSVGGFLSHCGWNSFQEAVRGGVPIIGWPLVAEQAMNARFIVSVGKVGVEIDKTVEGYIVGEEVAKSIELLMTSDTGKEVRLRMQQLKKTAEAAVSEGGSSNVDLRAFMQEVVRLLPGKIHH